MDITKFLKEDLQFSDAELAVIAPLLAPKAQILEGHVLRQQDYSAKMGEIDKLQQQIADKDAALAAEAVEWSKLTTEEKKTSSALRESLNKTQAEALALKQRLEQVATDAGIDPAKALEGITVTPPKVDNPPPAAPDLSGYVPADQFAAFAQATVRLPAVLQTIAREHKQLTGEDLDTEALIVELETRAQTKGNRKSLDLRQIWNEQHQIDDKRAAKAKIDHDNEIKAAEERGAVAARTEMATPTAGAPGRHSVVLTRAVPQKSALSRSQPGEGHNTAVAAFTSGKYRTGAQK